MRGSIRVRCSSRQARDSERFIRKIQELFRLETATDDIDPRGLLVALDDGVAGVRGGGGLNKAGIDAWHSAFAPRSANIVT